MKESTLPIFLRELKLPVMLKNWKPLQEDAKRKGWSHTQYLSALCEYEVTERKSKRLQRRFYEARLPRGKSFETYDFKSMPQLDKRQVDALIQEDS
ncbi:MAG: ATP-binding protein, partial [Waddliaceae bacterium]